MSDQGRLRRRIWLNECQLRGRELQFTAYETSRCSSLLSEEQGRCQHDAAVNSRFGSTADSRPLDRSMSGVGGNCHRDAALEWQQLVEGAGFAMPNAGVRFFEDPVGYARAQANPRPGHSG